MPRRRQDSLGLVAALQFASPSRSLSPFAVASVFARRIGEPTYSSNTLSSLLARARATSSRSARHANVVRAVRLAVGAGGADGDLAASAVHAEAVAPSVILARGAIEKVLFFQQAERGAAFAVLRVKALRGDLHLVGVATRCGLRVLTRAVTLRPPQARSTHTQRERGDRGSDRSYTARTRTSVRTSLTACHVEASGCKRSATSRSARIEQKRPQRSTTVRSRPGQFDARLSGTRRSSVNLANPGRCSPNRLNACSRLLNRRDGCPGKIFPGLSRFCGSKTRFNSRCSVISSGDCSSFVHTTLNASTTVTAKTIVWRTGPQHRLGQERSSKFAATGSMPLHSE
jgi:hypothetical protein